MHNFVYSILPITLTLFCVALVNGQSPHPDTDSMVQIINSKPDDSTMTAVLRSVIWNNLGYDSNFALEYSDKLVEHGLRIKSDYLIAKGSHYKGIAYRYLEDFDNSILELNKAIAFYQETRDTTNLINPLYHLGVTYSLLGKYPEAMDAYFQQLALTTAADDTINMGACHNSIGILYKNMHDYEKARHHYKIAIRFLSGMESGAPDLAMTMSNMATAFLKARNLDSALYYNQESTLIELRIGRMSGVAFNYDQRANIFQSMDASDSVIFYLSESSKLYENIGDDIGISRNYISLSHFYNEADQYRTAEKYAKEALDLMESKGSWPDRQDALHYLIQAKAGLGQFRDAYELQSKWIDSADSVRNFANQQSLDELNLKYRTAEKDLEISTNQLKIQKQKTQRNQLLGLAIGLLGLLFGSYLYQRQKMSKNTKIAQQESEIAKQRITQLEREQKIDDMSVMIEGQESERRRIAKDLHDGLGSLLATVKAKMGQIQSHLDDLSDLNVYQATNEMIDQACDEVRRISHNMMPGILRIEGLEGAIEDLSDQIVRVHGIEVKLDLTFEQERLSEAQSHMIYRIVQEATNNIVKHSRATEVLLQVLDYSDHLNVVIEDNGVGYDQDKTSEGLGLRSIQSRVGFLNGSIDTSTSSEGTLISLNFPLV